MPAGLGVAAAAADRVGTGQQRKPVISDPDSTAPATPPEAPGRQVFYLPGFDPREPETYWGLFRREARITAGRRGLSISVSDPVRSADGVSLDWQVENGGVPTRYTLLRWDEIVRERFPRPNGRRLADVAALWWRLWCSGYLRRFRREARRFATIIVGVHLIYLALVLGSLGLAALIVDLVPVASPWRFVAVPPLAYALLAGLMRLTKGRPLYVAHLVDDTTFTHVHAAGGEPRMAPRLDAFAERIRAAEGRAGEIVVIGHSSSSFLGIEVLDRVLARDPGFGARGTPVTFVSIGSVIPWLGLDPRAEGFREAMERFGQARAIGWLDVRADWDWLSIHLRNPLVACGLPCPGPGRPTVIRVRASELMEHAVLRRRKWNLFHLHFQLLMSSRSPEAFDYVALVSGAEPVHTLVTRWGEKAAADEEADALAEGAAAAPLGRGDKSRLG